MTTTRSLNKVMLIGNLTRPPMLRKTTNGAVVATFGVATNATWKDSDGNLQERAEFHNIVAWNKLAEICAQILNTGMLVYLDGELRTRTWEDDNGVKHYRTEIKINDMKLLDAKDKNPVGIDTAYTSGSTASDDPIAYDDVEEVKEDADGLF
ncbi:MAG: single-stranded DNA-binding protein [Ignavibacteriae bacterium]|nr:single-stranded DNA-binding protein [Ignavibacteriota bacterium]